MAGSRRLLPKDASEIETVAENHLRNQVIGCTRDSHTQPKIDFPLGRKIQVNRRKDLLLLLADGVETRDRTQRTVVFQAARDFFREIVAELEIGRENESSVYARPMKGAVKRGIEGEVPRAELLIHDRADLPRPGVRGVAAALPAYFVREADADRPVPLGRDAHAGPDVAANVIPTLAALGGSENVKAGLKPIIETVSDLNGFVGIHLDFVVPQSAGAQRIGHSSEQANHH